MKNNLPLRLIMLLALSSFLFTSCSKDKPLEPEVDIEINRGLYILNEGAIGNDNASISFLDFGTKTVTSDIFMQANRTKLGDVANDMDIYGSLLYVIVNESNKVEILEANTARVVKTLNIESPRDIAFHSGKAFITSYTNHVFVLDTLSKEWVKEIPVGRTPEQIVAAGNRLYVANAGWADGSTGGEYDNTLSIIDPVNLIEESKIKVADNLTHVFTDGKGNIYANSTDIFKPGGWPVILKPARLHKINTTTKKVDTLGFGSGMMTFYQNTAYLMSFNYEPGGSSLLEMDLTNGALKPLEYFNGESLDNIHGLKADSQNGDLWLSSTDYKNPGKLFHYSMLTQKIEKYRVGLNPSVFIFK